MRGAGGGCGWRGTGASVLLKVLAVKGGDGVEGLLPL
jgi:hypothetical protein